MESATKIMGNLMEMATALLICDTLNMENHNFNRKINYFYGPVSIAILNFQR
jgi:hypothetical protein